MILKRRSEQLKNPNFQLNFLGKRLAPGLRIEELCGKGRVASNGTGAEPLGPTPTEIPLLPGSASSFFQDVTFGLKKILREKKIQKNFFRFNVM